MKVTNEHYAFIKQQMKDGIFQLSNNNKISPAEWFESIENSYKDYTNTRKLWDVYWGTGGNDWQFITFNDTPQKLSSKWNISSTDWVIIKFGFDCSARNNAQYNDDHLGTAIKKAYYEIKQEVGNE